MERQKFITAVIGTLDSFLSARLTGEECVQTIDDLMADEFPDDVPSDLYDVLHEMHNDFSLFEADEGIRNAHAKWYYGPEGLEQRAVVYRDHISSYAKM